MFYFIVSYDLYKFKFHSKNLNEIYYKFHNIKTALTTTTNVTKTDS